MYAKAAAAPMFVVWLCVVELCALQQKTQFNQAACIGMARSHFVRGDTKGSARPVSIHVLKAYTCELELN